MRRVRKVFVLYLIHKKENVPIKKTLNIRPIFDHERTYRLIHCKETRPFPCPFWNPKLAVLLGYPSKMKSYHCQDSFTIVVTFLMGRKNTLPDKSTFQLENRAKQWQEKGRAILCNAWIFHSLTQLLWEQKQLVNFFITSDHLGLTTLFWDKCIFKYWSVDVLNEATIPEGGYRITQNLSLI